MPQQRIPTHLITGFLGVGKTTAILHLLRHKPATERWAVLVNEFGEIGIDGAMLEGRGAAIKEIPGGCICCVAGVPMQVGLNQLLGTKPDRLLIEPTGLGHPQNIVDMLGGEFYRNILEVRAVITLVDARKIEEPRYREHATFRDQLQLADVVIANKNDLADARQRQLLQDYLAQLDPPKHINAAVEQGAIPLELLERAHAPHTHKTHGDHRHDHQDSKEFLPLQLPPGQLSLRRENHGLEHVSCGWLFAEELRFDFGRLFMLCSGLPADRLKAVVNTERGAFIFNAENGVLSVLDAPGGGLSRIEVIHRSPLPWDSLEQALRAALLEPAL
jgi:G3E family GTPase